MAVRNFKIDPPETWQDFEKMCHLLWMDLLNDPNTQMHGRIGQAQAGVDVYGTDSNSGKFTCIQCKGKDKGFGGKLTHTELLNEVNRVKKFEPIQPDVFILATTALNDKALQKAAREINEQHAKEGLFQVYVFGWNELKQRIEFSPRVMESFYSHLVNRVPEYLEGIGQTIAKIAAAVGVNQDEGTTNIDHNTVKTIFAEASSGLLNWPRSLQVGDKWIGRAEEENLVGWFDTEYYSTTVLLGVPGCGKSALLSKITQDLADKGETILAIKADQLDGEIKDLNGLSASLNLPDRIDKCIVAASKYGKVFLVLDQLDTLSGFVDVKTNRLSVLLSLVKILQDKPNVHIIASSRPFEFEYDERLSSINALKIQLNLFEWSKVEEILKENKIGIQNLDDGYKLFLSKPSNLNFYLKYVQENQGKVYLSHIELYEDIWLNSLGKGTVRDRRTNLLMKASSEMTNDAKQILPIVRYEEYTEDIEWLVSAGLLLKSKNNKSFSFTHQTLQTYIWTRSFVKHNNSLFDFVINHQNNLNVRPKIATILYYLRESDPEEYDRQIKHLLEERRNEVRVHVVHLLIDSICVQVEPNITEIAIMLKLVSKSSFKARIYKTISGKELWFDAISSTVVPDLMNGGQSDKFFASILLSPVYEKRRERVLELVRQYWNSDTSNEHLYRFLAFATFWDDDLLNVAEEFASRKGISEHSISHIAQSMRKKFTKYAIKLVGSWFNIKLEEAINTPSKPIQDLPLDADETDRIIHAMRRDSKERYENVLDVGNTWHFLNDLAEIEPIEFIDSIWPFFLRASGPVSVSYQYYKNSYRIPSGIWFHLSDEGREHRDAYLCLAIEKALTSVALLDCNRFYNLLNESVSSELMTVQRLLAKGVEVLSSQMPNESLNYLLGDTRRLKLGAQLDDQYCTSKRLIEKLSINVGPEARDTLEEYLMTYVSRPHGSEDDASDKKHNLQYNRRIVYMLLSSIPANLRSERVTQKLLEEERAFGQKVKFKRGYSGFVKQISPISLEQMMKAKKADLIKLLKEFNDKREDDWSENGVYVGRLELNRTFAQFAESNPVAAKEIILELDIQNLATISHGLEGIGKSEVSLEFLLELILRIEEKGINNIDFHDDAARAIKSKMKYADALDDIWCQRLESWLTSPDNEPPKKDKKESEIDSVNEILWGMGKMYMMPHGNFTVLDTITNGYLYRNTPNTESWCTMLQRRIIKGGDVGVWTAALAFLLPRALGLCKAADAEAVIDSLFHHLPETTADTEFAHTLAYAPHWASDNKLFEWLERIIEKNSPLMNQAVGEILGLALVIKRDDEGFALRIRKYLGKYTDVNLNAGFAHSLKHLWKDYREVTTPFVLDFLNNGNELDSHILLGILRDYEDFEISTEGLAILDKLIEKRVLERTKNRSAFVGRALSSLAYLEPKRVAELCNQVITLHGTDLGDITSGSVVDADELITTAITLHNLGPEYQSVGLDIFERLLAVDAYQVKEALEKIDNIPTAQFIQ